MTIWGLKALAEQKIKDERLTELQRNAWQNVLNCAMEQIKAMKETKMRKLYPTGSAIFDDYARGWNDCVDRYQNEMIPIGFIVQKQSEYESLLEYDLYENDDIEESKYYHMKNALFEVLKAWEKENEGNNTDRTAG